MAERLSTLQAILNEIQGSSLTESNCDEIIKALDNDKNVKPQLLQRLLEMCIQDPKDDVNHLTKALDIICVISMKVTAGEFTTKPDLLPSLLKTLHMIKTSVYSSTSELIKLKYFKLLTSYPDDVYLEMKEDCEVLELFNLYCHQRIPIELRAQPFNVLLKYLKVLPPDKRLQFVKKGINTWLLKLVPTIMSFVTMKGFEVENPLQALEIITDELLHCDYFDNPNWKCVLQCFYEPQKYPAIMKNLLVKGSNIWHRLWTVYVKMLKNQITKSSPSGSPINSMLPVVETAFKMDVTNRCRAFYCWNVLIDNFATETNEGYIHKRIKLLLIPLYSNNAKNEDTIIAKLKTWWHLICGFYSKINSVSDVIIIPFLQFCFGKPNVFSKSVSAQGLLTNKTMEHCVETFVTIFGHHNCDGCVPLPKLNDKIISEKCLLDSRENLTYSMNEALKIAACNPRKLRQPFKCAWMSYVKLICDLPEDKVRKDYFKELLAMVEGLSKEKNAEILSDIILNDLILTLFNGDIQILQLLNSIDEKNCLLNKIIVIVLNPSFDSSHSTYDMTEAIERFTPLIAFILEHYYNSSILEDLFNKLLANYKSLVFWTTMASQLCGKKHDVGSQVLHKMLLWPIKHLDLFTNVDKSTSVWLELLDIANTKAGITSPTEDEIFEVLNHSSKSNAIHSFFLGGSIVLLTNKIKVETGFGCEKETLLLKDIRTKIHGLKPSLPEFLTLLEILHAIFKKLSKYISQNIAKLAFMTLKVVFTLLLPTFEKPNEVNSELSKAVEQVLKSITDLLKLEDYVSFKQSIQTELIEYAKYFAKLETLKVTVVNTLQILLNSMDGNNSSTNIIKKILDSLNLDSVVTEQAKFTTPCTLSSKKAKKKETSIMNTVVENGEEFVVVKSNWKFNPKKLTDNQKEKLQRKREDIPALYQDLSQSQDEFKLSTWKTDSQDTTTTSKSNDLETNEKVSSILKNMPNTDVVPKILETILTENNKKKNTDQPKKEDNNKMETPTNKEQKSRLALKDRVFRNVTVLIGKSSNVQNGGQHVKPSIDDIKTRPQTPTGMINRISDNVCYSAPLEINTERPSRVKRKPKKFEEMQLISVKRRRLSLGNNEPQNGDFFESVSNDKEVPDPTIVEKKICTLNKLQIEKKQKSLDTSLVENVVKFDVIEQNNIHNLQEEKFAEDEKIVGPQPDTPLNVDKITSRVDMNVENSSAVSKSTDNVIDKNNRETNKGNSIDNLTNKKRGRRKSRIEKELAIDMVEGHPFLKNQSEKRLTRKKVAEFCVTPKRKSLGQKVNKLKAYQNEITIGKEVKVKDKTFDKSMTLDSFPNSQGSQEDTDSQDSQNDVNSQGSQDDNGSQDIIESSQDSTISIVSVKSGKTLKRVPVVKNMEHKNDKNSDVKQFSLHVENSICPEKSNKADECSKTNDKIDNVSTISNYENNDDSEFSRNKTAIGHVEIDLTENLDTEPIGNLSNDDVIVIGNEEKSPTVINLEDTYVDLDTQDTADADTQPMDSNISLNVKAITNTPNEVTQTLDEEKILEHDIDSKSNVNASVIETQDDRTRTLTESLLCATDPEQCENTSKLSVDNEEQRKQDFFDNISEISPIKTLSPVRENKSPSPDSSSDYVVIKLSSPVQSNGEPFEKCDSPEIFTEDKVSPDKRDQSPPREETHATTASPRSLSLKKNKPQVRSGGRAAQMLGLCVPATDRLQTILNAEKPAESEEVKKSSPLNSTARRNLRILYNSSNDNNETSEESEESKSFLKMNRSLPAADSSPAVPILKRKLVDIIDDSTASPASKRKRVSFHDPPVSTTICVKKYIEPCGVRSPQSSAAKRQEKQVRSQAGVGSKSQKRLDTVFKLDTALTKAVESFSDATPQVSSTLEDTEMSSLEPTPLVEIVKNSELNDVDPICMDLVDCKDPIDNIAGDLSSSAMRPLLVKEFTGKIETVGDLAKLTELEVNRLCIKAPKVQVTRKVLTEYAKRIKIVNNEMTPMTEAAFSESSLMKSAGVDVEMQTDSITVKSLKVQTERLEASSSSTQTVTAVTVDSSAQTNESGSKTTADMVSSLMEKYDFCEHLIERLDVPSKLLIARSLPLSAFTDTFVQQLSLKHLGDIIDKLLLKHTLDSPNGRNDNQRLSLMQDFLSERFSSKDLILLCSDLLKKVYDKNN